MADAASTRRLHPTRTARRRCASKPSRSSAGPAAAARTPVSSIARRTVACRPARCRICCYRQSAVA